MRLPQALRRVAPRHGLEAPPPANPYDLPCPHCGATFCVLCARYQREIAALPGRAGVTRQAARNHWRRYHTGPLPGWLVPPLPGS